ncbi:MAG: MarR family transcriptional regulator [Desulfobacterium sp.]|nr:MarR family transcriptional regulator [Desulfobacterium sp.]
MDDNLCCKLNYLVRLMLFQVNERVKPHGVTQGQVSILCCLQEEEGQTQAELCRKIQVEQPTMANTLRRMERDGLIVRTISELDKRQVLIHLTERIRPTVAALQQKRDEVIACMTQHMSPEDMTTFNRLLNLALNNLEHPETDQPTGD